MHVKCTVNVQLYCTHQSLLLKEAVRQPVQAVGRAGTLALELAEAGVAAAVDPEAAQERRLRHTAVRDKAHDLPPHDVAVVIDLCVTHG